MDKLEYTGEKDDMISYISGVVAPDALSPKENAAFYSIISGVNSKNEAITQLYFINPVQFEFDSKSKKMRWKGEGHSKPLPTVQRKRLISQSMPEMQSIT